jgi:hypothetical protein
MLKTYLAALIGSIFPAIIGPGNNPNVALNGAMPDITSLNASILNINPFQETNVNTAANTTGFTAGGPQIAGAAQNFLILSGTLGAGAALTLPTVAALLASLPANVQAAPVGTSWQLRVVVLNAAAFSWTVTTNTGWTLVGAQTLAANTWRDFVIQITSATTATITSVGLGTTP